MPLCLNILISSITIVGLFAKPITIVRFIVAIYEDYGLAFDKDEMP